MRPTDGAFEHGEQEQQDRVQVYRFGDERCAYTLRDAPGSTLAPDAPEASPDVQRARLEALCRDATSLRNVADALESIDTPLAETATGRLALARTRAWILDVVRGCRSSADALDEA